MHKQILDGFHSDESFYVSPRIIRLSHSPYRNVCTFSKKWLNIELIWALTLVNCKDYRKARTPMVYPSYSVVIYVVVMYGFSLLLIRKYQFKCLKHTVLSTVQK